MDMYLVIHTLLIVATVSTIAVKSSKDIHCAACKAVVSEIVYAVSKEDSQKVIEIEGFRIDPQGNQKSRVIPYARSEVHLTEITENLCSQMNMYGQSIDKSTNKISFVRTGSRDGKSVTLENISMGGKISENLRYLCEIIIEKHEEDIIKFFKENHGNYVQGFCSNVTKLCDGEKAHSNDEL